MAFPSENSRAFRLFVTHVHSEHHFLKISGQLDQQSSLMVETLFKTASDDLEKGVGVVPPAAIQEGIICAAKYKDGSYYRAKIISTTHLATGLVGVHFIDYGNKDIISLSTIRFLNNNYDPLFLQLRGQATDYILARVMHPPGRWDEQLVLKLQSLLCNAEYPATLEAQTHALPIISINFKGNDLSKYIVRNRFGIAVTVAQQEALLLQISGETQQVSNWQPSFGNDSAYTEHVPFMLNQNFPLNPAAAMRLQQNISLPFNNSVPPPSIISQRLIVNKVSRTPVNVKAPVNQPQQPAPSAAVHTTPPPLTHVVASKLPSPKKATTYKTRLLEVNSQHNVLVSFAEEGPEIFAVQLTSDAKKLQDFMDDVNKRPHRSLTEPPMIGTICLGRMSGDRIICRAVVTNLSGSQCKLFFVDFGDTEMVSYYDIFDIPEEFVQPNVFAIRFCLSKVKKLEKGTYLNEIFKQLVNGKVLTLRVVEPEGPPLIQYGELYLNNQNVFDLLVANMKEKLQFKWMEMLPLGSRNSVLVSYVDSCIKFYIQLSEMIDELNAVMDAVKVHCENSSSPGQLPVGAACCARFPDDDNWYRVRIRDTKGDKVVVAYVDYGNEQEVSVSDLRTITSDLIQLPAQAMKCALKGYEDKPVETKTSNQLEMLALEKTLNAHVVGVLSNDTMLILLVDDTVSPPLDVARRMTQLSAPRSNIDTKTSPPVRREASDTFSSPEGSEDKGQKSFRWEKRFKDERRPPRETNDDFGQRGSSFRDRRGGSKPWETNTSPPAPAPVSGGDDEWEESTAAPAAAEPSSHFQPPRSDNRNNNRDRDRDNKFTENEWEEKKTDRGDRTGRDNRPPNRRDNRNFQNQRRDFSSDRRGLNSDRRDFNSDRREVNSDRRQVNSERREFNSDRRDFQERDNWDRPSRSNFNPRDRAEKSFDSDTDKKSDNVQDGQDREWRAPPYKSRSKFTEIQYKELANPVDLTTPFEEPVIEPNPQHEVSVTWVISPKNFYTQILSQQTKFLDMMQKIPNLYKGVKSYSGNIPVNASVLARYPDDGVLYRAEVVSIQPSSKFIVRYVDFGNKQLVDYKDIWQLDQELMELPKMAVHCSLLGVAPKDGEWKADPEIDLCLNAPRYQCVFQDNVDAQWHVSLWNNGVSVADMLVEKELAVASDALPSVALKDEPIDLSIIVGQQFLCKVTHVESFEKFCLQLDLDKAAMLENTIAIFDTAKLTPVPSDTLVNDIHCTVQHDGKIYRAILNDISDTENIQAVLPDYRIPITTKVDNLMILPEELSACYYQALECCLNNYTAESKTLMTVEELKTRLTGNKFVIYINDVVDDHCLVSTLYDVSTGKKVAIFEPDEGAYEEVIPLCTRAVFNYNFGLAYISHSESLNEIYLQKATDTDKIAGLLADLYSFYEEGTPEELTSFEVDGLCAARSADGNWYRATIVSAEGDNVTVQFSDYGNTETLPKDSLKKLDPQFHEPCVLALVVGLGLVALQEDALSKLIEWTTEKEIKVTVGIGTDGWLASLHLDGVDLSMKMVNEKLATPQVNSQEGATVEAPAKPISLPEGCTRVYISHIDTPGHFWLQLSDQVDAIEKIQAELQENAETYAEIENRDMGTLCVAKYLADDQWYRAEILDSDADITTVRFIDYGNTDVLDNKPGLIKVIPDPLKEIERYALKSSVNAISTGTEEWSEPASKFFTQLLGDLSAPVDALIVLKDITTYVDIFVNGQNLTEKIVSEGYATRSEELECGGNLPSCFASHINSLSEFWIQLESATPELQAMESALLDAENFSELTSKEEGVLCAAKYPEDGGWYRAQVIVVGSEGTEVLFMDYGDASIANELRTLPDELKAKPALSRKCALQKPRDIKSWSRKSEIKFNELAAEGATIFNVQIIACGDISIVELYLEGKSVTEELVGLCEEQPTSERPTPFGQDNLSSGKICYVNSLEEFYVQLDESTSDLDKIFEKLLQGSGFEPVSEMKVGSICAAFWDEDKQWYRAKVLEFCDEGYHVQFIDYGNKAKCQEFKELPEDITVLNPIAKYCRLAGLSEDSSVNEAIKSKLDHLAADESTTIQIEFLDSTKDPALVKLLLDGKDVTVILNDGAAKEVFNVISGSGDFKDVNEFRVDNNESITANAEEDCSSPEVQEKEIDETAMLSETITDKRLEKPTRIISKQLSTSSEYIEITSNVISESLNKSNEDIVLTLKKPSEATLEPQNKSSEYIEPPSETISEPLNKSNEDIKPLLEKPNKLTPESPNKSSKDVESTSEVTSEPLNKSNEVTEVAFELLNKSSEDIELTLEKPSENIKSTIDNQKCNFAIEIKADELESKTKPDTDNKLVDEETNVLNTSSSSQIHLNPSSDRIDTVTESKSFEANVETLDTDFAESETSKTPEKDKCSDSLETNSTIKTRERDDSKDSVNMAWFIAHHGLSSLMKEPLNKSNEDFEPTLEKPIGFTPESPNKSSDVESTSEVSSGPLNKSKEEIEITLGKPTEVAFELLNKSSEDIELTLEKPSENIKSTIDNQSCNFAFEIKADESESKTKPDIDNKLVDEDTNVLNTSSSSQIHLNQSSDRIDTVTESKSFEANVETLHTELAERKTPEKDKCSDSLEINSTIKTSERNDSKDSVNTHTGYMARYMAHHGLSSLMKEPLNKSNEDIEPTLEKPNKLTPDSPNKSSKDVESTSEVTSEPLNKSNEEIEKTLGKSTEVAFELLNKSSEDIELTLEKLNKLTLESPNKSSEDVEPTSEAITEPLYKSNEDIEPTLDKPNKLTPESPNKSSKDVESTSEVTSEPLNKSNAEIEITLGKSTEVAFELLNKSSEDIEKTVEKPSGLTSEPLKKSSEDIELTLEKPSENIKSAIDNQSCNFAIEIKVDELESKTKPDTDNKLVDEDTNILNTSSSSQIHLNQSSDRIDTVTESKSFEANVETLDTELAESEAYKTPENDKCSDSLETNSTIKTRERDDSKDSVNTDTGYMAWYMAHHGLSSSMKETDSPPIKKVSSEGDSKTETKVEDAPK